MRVSQPEVDVTDPNMIGEEIGEQAPGQLGKPVEQVDDLGRDAKNLTDEGVNSTTKRLR